jgi:DNA (cytosine-5)-methyltransferase 1
MSDENSTMQVSYPKVGRDKRGQSRLWLEGLRLAKSGFSAGERYRVVFDLDARTIALELTPDGDRLVSGRRPAGKDTPTPILDLASASVTDIVGDAGSVRAVITYGRIVFTLHPRDMARAEREQRTRGNLAAGELVEGTLCAGGGIASFGVNKGIEGAGLSARLAWVVDRERKYLEVADANNPAIGDSTVLFEASLEEVQPDLLGRVDVLQMSLPCTGHSKAGRSKRGLAQAEDHPTDALAVYGALRILDAVQPTVVISENVTEAATSATYAMVRAYLRDAGYVLFERVMDESDAGTIERRKRWWFVAISEGMANGFDFSLLEPTPREFATLGDALEPVPTDDPQWRRHDYLDRKQERDAAEGKGFARQLVTKDSEHVGTVGRFYQKRRSTEPFVQREDGLERLLTPVEHARIKGIPPELIAGTSEQTAHEILGQSILLPHAVALGMAVGRHLRAALAGIYLAVVCVVPAASEPEQSSLAFD